MHDPGRTPQPNGRSAEASVLTKGEKQDGAWRLRSGNPAIVGLSSVRPVALRPHLSVGLPLAAAPLWLRPAGKSKNPRFRRDCCGRTLAHEEDGLCMLERL